ncbi:MAG: TrmB family transcriptional regulator [Candidatus Woesearchaeota archaeon]
MSENIPSLLKEYGLDENETNIYLHLVRKRELTAYQIAKDIHIHRSNCYNILDRLVEKGFVAVSTIRDKKLYSPNELTNVLGKIKNKESILLSIMPEIKKIQSTEDTTVNYANTKNSFAQFNTNLYNMAKNRELTFAYMISNSPDLTTKSSRILGERLLVDLKNSKSLKSIDCRAIWDVKFKNHKFMQQFAKLGKNRFLKNLPNQATTFIYDKHVAFVFLDETDCFIEIKSGIIAKEMKSYFEYLWSIAKK